MLQFGEVKKIRLKEMLKLLTLAYHGRHGNHTYVCVTPWQHSEQDNQSQFTLFKNVSISYVDEVQFIQSIKMERSIIPAAVFFGCNSRYFNRKKKTAV